MGGSGEATVQPATDAPTQQETPSPQQTQQIAPVPANSTGSTAAPSRVDPPTLVLPAVRPDAATGSQPITPGRR
jgi:hypothetical protein